MVWRMDADKRELRGARSMPEPGKIAESGFRGQQREQLSSALHEMCQPLTTLQCRLEMAALTDSVEEYREAAETGMADCQRLAELVRRMRKILCEATCEAGVDGMKAES